jgi:type IV pilus assembly protein PilW
MRIRPPIRSCGHSLVEVLVGALIGLLTVLVIYQVFAVAEGFKRNTTGAADAQQNGLFSLYTLGIEVANAGNGLATAATELDSCPDTGDIRTSMRPLPVLITDGADLQPPRPNADAFVASYGAASRRVSPAEVVETAAAGAAEVRVRSPAGFRKGDLVVAIAAPAAGHAVGRCERRTVAAVSAADQGGIVTLTLDSPTAALSGQSVLLDLGPAAQARRVLYDVSGDVLRSTDLLVAGAVANPLASNVVVMKLQYGIDGDGDGFLDRWVGGTGDWSPDKVMAMPTHPAAGAPDAPAIVRIKAVRLGVVVRSEQFDRDVTAPYGWTLFDCSETDRSACPGRLTGSLPANWRYRTYETVIPLRNQIWNSPA